MRLFDEVSLQKLEQLTLLADSVRVGALKGDRRSRRRGVSIEFADYRDYARGDDLRRLDWNIFARLDRPFIKLTQAEEELSVHIIVDTSSSMDWPIGIDDTAQPTSKLRHGLQFAGALGYIGLLSGDFVVVSLIDSSGRRKWGPFRGRQNGWLLIKFLEAHYQALTQYNDSGPRRTNLGHLLTDYNLRGGRPGLLFLISDLLSSGDVREGMTSLLSRGFEPVLLHILSQDEMTPGLTGDLKLVDVETGETAEITIDPMALEEYADKFSVWQEAISRFCQQRGIHYSLISTDTPWEQVILHNLRRQGVIR